ncbi:MAG: hypothetical protein Q8Q09_09260 [Deltaproteobacteria bacterium]|nr:hypothetical protein [Deltaproteobacteria bacterium]
MPSFSPKMQRYLDALPRDLDSYPECQMKASVLRSFFADTERIALISRVPAPLASLLMALPPPSSWIPEVHTTAIFLAFADMLGSDEQLIQHAYKTNVTLIDSNMYRILFRMVGVTRLLSKASVNWAQFHKGSIMALDSVDQRQQIASIAITTPPHHLPELMARAYATAIQAATELAGAKKVTSTLSRHEPTRSLITVKWT